PLRHVVAGMAAYGNAARLRRVLELAMASFSHCDPPPVCLEEANDITHLHDIGLSALPVGRTLHVCHHASVIYPAHRHGTTARWGHGSVRAGAEKGLPSPGGDGDLRQSARTRDRRRGCASSG